MMATIALLAVMAASADWPYERDFTNRLLLLHPLANYAVHPELQAAWDSSRVDGSALLTTIGSVHTEELLVDLRWAMNVELSSRLRFRGDGLWNEARHLPFERRHTYLGLEGRIAGGETITAGEGVDWLVRQPRGPWTLTSEGHWLRMARRRHTDTDARRDNWLTLRLRRDDGIEAAFALDEFAISRQDHDYGGQLRHLVLRAPVPVAARWRAELHRAWLRAEAYGQREFRYRRAETIAGVYAAWRWLEAGYLNTWYDWRYAGGAAASGRADKISLATHLKFAGGAVLRFSLSHEVNLHRFGGFNVQFSAPLSRAR